MKSIKILSGVLKVFGWLSIILGALFLIQTIFGGTVSLLLILSNTLWFLNGLVFLFLAEGLSKKEKWAWYTALVIFILGLFSIFMEAFLIEFSAGTFLYILIYILLFGLLLCGRQPFIEQPKEGVSQWFRKPYFVVVVAGTLISTLVSGGILAYSVSKRMEVELPPETIETKNTELTIYKNEKYNFIIEYFTDKLAIERDYETKRLSNNPKLLFDVFFYDSDYGVNIAETKSIPVITVEVFECKEGDFNKCYGQIICGPRRYTTGSMGSSYGSSYFRIDGLPTNSLSFAWKPQEEMRGNMVLKDQLLYVVLARTGSKEFKPVSEDIFNQIRSTFKFIKVEGGKIKAPDLTIEDTIWMPANPKIGDTISIKIKVKNIGNEVSPSAKITAIDQKGWGQGGEIKALEPKEETTITLTIYAKSVQVVENNPHTFSIKVDSDNRIDELNEDNNEKTEIIYVSSAEEKTSGGTIEPKETECEKWRKECAKEGEGRCTACGCRDCCSDLVSRQSIHPYRNKTTNEVVCLENMVAYVCVKCGDGICGQGEDWCICPEDCEKPNPSDLMPTNRF